MAEINNLERGHFIHAYIEALLWTETGPDHDIPYEAELAEAARAKVATDCHAFMTANALLLRDAIDRIGYSAARAGHDFWLTRNGHGAGYWDRKELENEDPEDAGKSLGDQLTDATKGCGECDVYQGDDGLLYLT